MVRTPVITHATSSQPAEPTCRAISAETMKMPEPMMMPATIMMESTTAGAGARVSGSDTVVPLGKERTVIARSRGG